MPDAPPFTQAPPWWRAWLPAAQPVGTGERLRAAVGVGLGLLVAAALGWVLRPGLNPGGLWLMAPLGASAVLVFVLPASPLAQPWAVVGGNTLAAVVGVACLAWLPLPALLLAPLAAALAVAATMAARCVHPPAGATALLMVLGGQAAASLVFFPVLVNSLALVAAGLAYHRLTGRRYPHPQQPAPAAPAAPQAVPPRFTDADLDAVLARRKEVLDVPRDELLGLLADAEVQAHARRLAQWPVAAVMSRPAFSLRLGATVANAARELKARDIKALPVVDASQHVVGIVTRADVARATVPEEAVSKVMTRRVRVISAERSLGDVVPVFVSHKHHHLPVVDEQLRLVGVVTQTDVLRALLKAG